MSHLGAILVPWHRAVRRDGSPGGYRWGLERKRALLARERERKGQSAERLVGSATMLQRRSAGPQ